MAPPPSNSGALWRKLTYSSQWSFSGSLPGASGRSPEWVPGVELEFELELELELELESETELELQLETEPELVPGVQD